MTTTTSIHVQLGTAFWLLTFVLIVGLAVWAKLSDLDFEGKRLALEMLGIKVWLDGEAVEITGTINPEMSGIATTLPLQDLFPLSLKRRGG